MYAHQVITDIEKHYKKVHSKTVYKNGMLVYRQDSKDFYTFYHSMIPDIKKAAKFNLSGITGLYQKGADNRRKKGFRNFNGALGDVKLPYDICWFDYDKENLKSIDTIPYDSRTNKCGLLVYNMPLHDDMVYEFDSILLVYVFNYMDKDKVWYPGPISHNIGITPDEGVPNIYTEAIVHMDKEDQDRAEKEDGQDISVLNYALMFLSCKNIGTNYVNPDPKRVRLLKKRKKLPPYKYHILVIKPTTTRQKSMPKHLWHNGIHTCLGHFKTYTEERPLLGCHVGKYWWQPHIRGKNEDRVIEKDYHLEE